MNVRLITFLADDGLCVKTDVYQVLRIPVERKGGLEGASRVRTCHEPGFTRVSFLPASPTVATSFVAEGKGETADIDATAAGRVVDHARCSEE